MLESWRCGLYTSAAYTQVRLIHKSLRYSFRSSRTSLACWVDDLPFGAGTMSVTAVKLAIRSCHPPGVTVATSISLSSNPEEQ